MQHRRHARMYNQLSLYNMEYTDEEGRLRGNSMLDPRRERDVIKSPKVQYISTNYIFYNILYLCVKPSAVGVYYTRV